jgi:hypothetical protein
MSRINAKNPRGRPFAPGNPGKQHGARHRVTRAVEALMEGEHEKLTRIAIDKALDGDTAALRLCLDRIARPRRDAPVSIELPLVRSAADAAEASASLLASVAKGEVTPDEAARIMALLEAHKSIMAAGDLERRIAALEAAPR